MNSTIRRLFLAVLLLGICTSRAQNVDAVDQQESSSASTAVQNVSFSSTEATQTTRDITTTLEEVVQEEVVTEEVEEDGYVKPDLGIDRAWFTVNSSVNYDLEIWAQSDECYKCNLMYIDSVPADTIFTLLVNTSYATTLKLIRLHPGGNPRHMLCSFDMTFREGGDYWVFIDYPRAEEETSCNLVLVNDPPNAQLPILFVLVGLVSLAILYALGHRLYDYVRHATAHRRSNSSMDINTIDGESGGTLRNGKTFKESSDETGKQDEKKKSRLRCLDTFRGLTLVLMIFVNYGGGHYWFFEHSPWNGVYVADLVFPWFVFIMGVSINFSFRSMAKKEWSVRRIAWKIVWRALKLFILGFMLGTFHWVADLPNVRIFGVLQRLALTYLISSFVHFACVRNVASHQDSGWAPVRDLVLYIPEWLANLALLALHLGIVYGFPVPGCPTGYVGPGGISEGGKFSNCTGGATRYVDELILGDNHLYRYPTPQAIYQTSVPFDPEGVLATLNCVFLSFLGIQCGRIFLIFQECKQRLIRIGIWSLLLGALAALLTKCSQEDGWVPPNKNLWSISYTLITASFAYVLLGFIYILVDVFNFWQGQPFIYPGMNSIVIYVCHFMFYKTFPISWAVEQVHWKLLLQCVWATLAWVIVSYWLFVKKIFIAL